MHYSLFESSKAPLKPMSSALTKTKGINFNKLCIVSLSSKTFLKDVYDSLFINALAIEPEIYTPPVDPHTKATYLR